MVRDPLSGNRLVMVYRHTSACHRIVQVGSQAMADRYTYIPPDRVIHHGGLGCSGSLEKMELP